MDGDDATGMQSVFLITGENLEFVDRHAQCAEPLDLSVHDETQPALDQFAEETLAEPRRLENACLVAQRRVELIHAVPALADGNDRPLCRTFFTRYERRDTRDAAPVLIPMWTVIQEITDGMKTQAR